MQAFIPNRSITAAKRQQRKGARVDAALDRHLPDRVGLAHVTYLDYAAGKLLVSHVARQSRRQRRDPAARAFDIERDAAPDQRWGNPPQHQIGIGNRRLVASVRIAHRPRLGAGAARANPEMALAADPGDRAAARAGGLDINHLDSHRERTARYAS